MFYASTLSSSLSPSDDRCRMAARIDSVRLKIVTDRRRMHHAVAGMMRPASVSTIRAIATVAAADMNASNGTVNDQSPGTYSRCDFLPVSYLLHTLSAETAAIAWSLYMNPVYQSDGQRSRLYDPPRSYGINRHGPTVGWS